MKSKKRNWEETKMKILTRMMVVLILSVGAFAQITMTQANAPQIGNSSTNYDAGTVNFDPTANGSNQSWNITSHEFTANDYNDSYIAPSSTPYASEFPTATIATVSGNDPDFTYVYLRVAGNGMYLLGSVTLFDGDEFFFTPDNEVLILPFPVTMNTSWTSVFRITSEFAPGFVTMTVDSSIFTVTAWGTMTTPTWSESSLKALEHGWTAIYFNGEQQGDIAESWSYLWWTLNPGHSVSFTSNEDNGQNFTSGDLSYTTTGTVDVPAPRGPVSESFKLSQNYPNPFNPTTVLPIELSKSAKIELTIYNEAGQAVYNQSMDLSAGQHSLPIDGSAWGSGSYFAKVMTGNEVQSTRMVLVK
jgi:hypothetical protein